MSMKVAEGGKKAGSGAKPDINVTPLIDVLLVLLIIFMVITPLKPHKLESKVPERVQDTTVPNVNPFVFVLSLDISPAGTINAIKINNLDVTEDQLGVKLGELLVTRPPDMKTVFIRAARNAFYGEIVRVIDIAKKAGATPIGLQIDDLPEK
ncbi:MAG: biopolymer transporter ExbD [Acidobacteria bacterium]|nr:biopolymer transporter ExbD [Acidobacteriota bacterium]